MASHHGAYSAAPVGRARPSFDMNASSASVTGMGGDAATADLLREQQMERDRLQIENFNLMMRIDVLETRLANSQSTYTEDFEAELLQKRVEMEEKDAKIRQQKDHMMRAVEAIEQLKRQLAEAHSELERARAQSGQVEEMNTMRHMLAKTEEELQRRVQHMRETEAELANVNDERTALRVRCEEATEAKQRMEAEMNQLRQKLQQLDQQQTKGAMQVEHLQGVSKQRQEQLQDLSGRLDQATQEKQLTEAKYQTQMKRMEEHMRAQLEKLQQEGEKYRTEYMKVNGERDKVQFERERFMDELETVKKDKARYQAEWERIAKDMDRLNADAENIRIQNAKLNATCDHQAQTIENYKNDRESALDNLHKLESEVSEWRKRSSDQEVAVKTLEMRSKNAEAEVARLQERLEAVTARTNQTANERLVAVEQGKNAAESQNYELRKNLASLQHELEAARSKCQSYDALVNEETANAKEFKERLIATERELRQHMAHGTQLERELAHLKNSSVSESERVNQYSDQLTRVTNERNQVADALSTERSRLEATQKIIATLEAQNQQFKTQFLALAQEIRGFTGFDEQELNYRTLVALVKEAKTTLQRTFKADAETLIRRWQEHTERTRNEIDRLSSKLHACHAKIETLQRSTLHAKDDAKSIDRSWMVKYENLRTEYESTRRSLEELVRAEKTRNGHLEASLSHARGDLDAMTQSRNGTMFDFEREIEELKKSNHLLLGEVRESRKSAERARKQYLAAVAENKDLLSAVDILKNGIVERDKQIEDLKSTILRTTQHLQRGGSMVEVKQKLLEQLDQTQYMVNETYKKWSHSDVGLGLNGFHGRVSNNAADGETTAWSVQLDEHIGRLEMVCDQWRDCLQQSRDMQRRYGDVWRSAALSFGKGKERPVWVDDIERKCSFLLSESVHISTDMREIAGELVSAMQRLSTSSKRKHRKSQSAVPSRRRSSRDRNDLSPVRENNANNDVLSLEHFNGDIDSFGAELNGNNNTNDILFMNRGKRVSVSTSRSGGGSRASASRGGASTIYGHSLASLSRIGDELKIIEKKIKTYPDE